MFRLQVKFFAKQKHSKVFDSALHCVEFNFIRSVVAF